MKKQLSKLIPKDKLLHNFWGKYIWLVVFLFSLLFFDFQASGLIALSLSLLVAVLIEVYDYFGSGEAELLDIIATVEIPVYFTLLIFLIE